MGLSFLICKIGIIVIAVLPIIQELFSKWDCGCAKCYLNKKRPTTQPFVINIRSSNAW